MMRGFVAALTTIASFSALESRSDELTRPNAVYREYALDNQGDALVGERIFRSHEQLVCTHCHGITGVEKSGPNLDGIADKYSREDLVKHILEPSASIKPGYEQVSILTNAGQVISGRLNRATKEIYRVYNQEGREITIDRNEVEQIHSPPTSLMPDNVAALISKEEFSDLVAYLETLHSKILTGFRLGNRPVEITKLATQVEPRPIHSPDAKFSNPVWCGSIPGSGWQMAVIEHQESRIWRLARSDRGIDRQLFLDLGDQVKFGNNWGLMCMAFHPDFARNGRYFLKHEVEEDGGVKTTVVERRAAADRRRDSGQPSRRLLEVDQPAFNHNGGCLAFGPDGMLYVAFGDGGPQRDPNGYSQNPRVFHGSILRIDVDHEEDGRPYAIPRDNPFLEAHRRDPEIRPETWAIGFREPWRFSFDRQTGDLWLGDVGQELFEEVCLVRRGENHGWNVFEAYRGFTDQYRRAEEAYTSPIFAYPHSFGVSVTGGYVYRGRRAPSFDGVYVFGDYETRRIWGLTLKNGGQIKVQELGKSPEHIASFGVDSEGEIYLVGYEGTVFHLDLSQMRYE